MTLDMAGHLMERVKLFRYQVDDCLLLVDRSAVASTRSKVSGNVRCALGGDYYLICCPFITSLSRIRLLSCEILTCDVTCDARNCPLGPFNDKMRRVLKTCEFASIHC